MDKSEGNREFGGFAVTETQFLAALVLLQTLGMRGTLSLLAFIAATTEARPAQKMQPTPEAQQKAAEEASAAIARASGK